MFKASENISVGTKRTSGKNEWCIEKFPISSARTQDKRKLRRCDDLLLKAWTGGMGSVHMNHKRKDSIVGWPCWTCERSGFCLLLSALPSRWASSAITAVSSLTAVFVNLSRFWWSLHPILSVFRKFFSSASSLSVIWSMHAPWWYDLHGNWNHELIHGYTNYGKCLREREREIPFSEDNRYPAATHSTFLNFFCFIDLKQWKNWQIPRKRIISMHKPICFIELLLLRVIKLIIRLLKQYFLRFWSCRCRSFPFLWFERTFCDEEWKEFDQFFEFVKWCACSFGPAYCSAFWFPTAVQR